MRSLFIIPFLITSFTAVSFAITIHVPADQPTIQAGLDIAVEGDTVLVAAGTYLENIIWPAVNGIKLIGSGEEDCIIDGDSLASVIRFEEDLGGIIDSTTMIKSFSLQYGNAQYYHPIDYGGGIFCYQSSPRLENLMITNNIAEDFGGGIYCEWNSNPNMVSVTIANNWADEGGGIYLSSSNPTMENVTITDNLADSYGGGICCWINANPNLETVTITNNSADNGGGIHCYSSDPILENVSITYNSADDDGGGINCYASNPDLVNTTITNNSAGDSGGGMYCMTLSNPNLENVIVSSNSTIYSGGGIYCRSSNPSLIDVTIEDNSATGEYGSGGGIYIYDESNLSISNTIIRENSVALSGGGIYCREANFTMIGSQISGNTADGNGGGFYFIYNNSYSQSLQDVTVSDNLAASGGGLYINASSPSLTDVTITNNEAIGGYGFGGGIECGNLANPSLSHVTINENSADFGGGIYFTEACSPVWEHLVITDNTAVEEGGGIYCSFMSYPTLTNVKITGNSANFGGGIACEEASPSFVNATIADNSAIEYGNGLHCEDDSHPVVENCIFWNSSEDEVYFAAHSYYDPCTITISCSDIAGGLDGIETNDNGTVFWLENNIDDDPLFCDPDNDDYRLQLDSPCRTDVCGFMGYTAETCDGEGVEEQVPVPSQFGLTNAYPNPFNPSTAVEFSLSSPGDATISVYNTRGQLVDVIQKGYMSAGYHTAAWTPDNLPSGVYFVELRAGGQRDVMKVGYVK